MSRGARITIVVALLVAVSWVQSAPASACSLAPRVVSTVDSATAGQSVPVHINVYEILDVDESTTTSEGPQIADCPPTGPVDSAVLRFVQGDRAIDVATFTEPPHTGFDTEVVIPASADSGPARLVIGSGTEVLATSEVIDITAPTSPSARPTRTTPSFTG